MVGGGYQCCRVWSDWQPVPWAVQSPAGCAQMGAVLFPRPGREGLHVPKAAPDAYVVLKPQLGYPLWHFTVCLRFFTDLVQPHALLAYASRDQDKEILLFRESPTKSKVYMGGKKVTSWVPPHGSSSGQWESVCLA